MPWGRGTVVTEPGQLGRVQHSGHYQLVLCVGMEGILVVNGVFQPQNAICQAGQGPPLQQVVDACHQEDPHGDLVLAIVDLVGMLEGRDGSTRYCHPVNMPAVRWALHGGVPGGVKLV